MNSSLYNQLSIFFTIVKEGGVRPAARKLELAPPSVSQALKQLENYLGLPLINRTTRQMELTDAGAQLYDRALPLASELSETVEYVKGLNKVPSGKLKITLPMFTFNHMLKPIYAKFCRQYPEIDLEISISDATVNIIKEGIDAGIRGAHKVEEGMVSINLTPPLKQWIVASPEYLEQHGEPLTPEDLCKHKFIRYRYISANNLAPLNLIENGEQISVNVDNAMIVNNPELMIDAAEKGLGISGVLAPLAKKSVEEGKLVTLLDDYQFSYPSLHLYFPQHSQKARRIRVLVDFLKEHSLKEW